VQGGGVVLLNGTSSSTACCGVSGVVAEALLRLAWGDAGPHTPPV